MNAMMQQMYQVIQKKNHAARACWWDGCWESSVWLIQGVIVYSSRVTPTVAVRQCKTAVIVRHSAPVAHPSSWGVKS